jgi:hypothetical protein
MIIRFYHERDLILTKVLTSELIDLQNVAHECELGSGGSINFRGPGDSKVSLPQSPLAVKALLTACGSEGDLYLYGKLV